jgi:ribosomal protein L19
MVVLEVAKETCIAEDEKVRHDRFTGTFIRRSHNTMMIFRVRNGRLFLRPLQRSA